ncbi:MAG: hypothetical protein V3S16_12205 [Candidatus Desulfatibia sp.]|uniref:hypothetical protein n=1 Tax=Candidatus Desulfatibia sp. TaxID=3101189 RepID=UPI002F2DD4AD
MSGKKETPFEIEVLAEYLKKGKSIIYLTKHDHDSVGKALKGMGMKHEDIKEKLSLNSPNESADEFAESISQNRPDHIMADSLSDVMKIRSHIKRGRLSCEIKKTK